VFSAETGQQLLMQKIALPDEMCSTAQTTVHLTSDDEGALVAIATVEDPTHTNNGYTTLNFLVYTLDEHDGVYAFSKDPIVIHPTPEFLSDKSVMTYYNAISRIMSFNGKYSTGDFSFKCITRRITLNNGTKEFRWAYTTINSANDISGTNCVFDDIVSMNTSQLDYPHCSADLDFIAGSESNAIACIPQKNLCDSVAACYRMLIWPGGLYDSTNIDQLESLYNTNKAIFPTGGVKNKGTGILSFLHNGHTMLVMLKRFEQSTIAYLIKFNVHEWKNVSNDKVPTFADLTPKWQIPSTQIFKFVELNAKFYTYTVLIDPELTQTTDSEATTFFYIYAPGAAIAAYKMTTPLDSPMRTGITVPNSDADSSNGISSPKFRLDGRTLIFDTNSDTGGSALNVAVHDLSGRLLLNLRNDEPTNAVQTGSAHAANSVDLSALSPGCYLVTVNGVTTKLHLR
jgi:hypothetical protein